MALPPGFLDEVRARTVLSSLIGRTVKVDKAGREFKACCPFHGEKTASFTINDAKGFYHCFGCGAHGDAFRWLTDHAGLAFMDAVKELAAMAGLEVPAPTPEAAVRAERLATVRAALDAAQAIYAAQLMQAGAVMEYLSGRGIGPAEIETFGIGYARGQDGSLKGRGIGAKLGEAAGLLVPRSHGEGFRELFWDRITIPIHDPRGQLVGFGGRIWPGRRAPSVGAPPKFVNSPDTDLFDKGRALFNLHRAAPAARPQAENRLVIVEGYFDVVALARVGIHAAVAPLGTALTETQLARSWRVHHRPIVLFDADKAGRAAAERACRTALPMLAPGAELAVALLPDGKDPDDLVQALGCEAAARAIGAALTEAQPLHAFLFDAVTAQAGASCGPEQIAAIWQELAALAGQIGHAETRVQYLGLWRARYDREVSALAPVASAVPLHAVQAADDGDYAFPESEDDSARRLISVVQAVLKKREERRAINEEIADMMKMAEAVGFDRKAINAAIKDIESDLEHGPARREEQEMQRVLYRRVLNIRGPMDEAMLPRLVDGRPRGASAQVKRKATLLALVDARGVDV